MCCASAIAIAITPRHFMSDQYRREKLVDIVPRAFGQWQVDTSIIPVPPSPDQQEVIDATYDESLALTYRNTEGQRVMLSLAYGRNQHKGMNTHRPEICYPAQGFKLAGNSQRGRVAASGREINVTRLVAAMGARNEPITYWLLIGDEVTFFGYPQRAAAVRYGLQGLIPDGVLVRVSSISSDNAAAFAMQDNFIADFLASVAPTRLPRFVGLR
jgi:EpsI family protein